jgi:lactate dehydrogenase-like 2-hydroxyacid dehydrogenase
MNARIPVTPRLLTAQLHPDVGELSARGYDVIYCTPGATPSEFEPEPPASLRLASHRRVIATSHVGGFTEESVDRSTKIAVDNLLLGLQGGTNP